MTQLAPTRPDLAGGRARRIGGSVLAQDQDWRATALAGVLLFLLGTRQSVPHGPSFGLLAAVVTAPIWFTAYARYRWARPVAALGMLALASGVALGQYSGADHVMVTHIAASQYYAVAQLLAGIGIVLWARETLPLPAIGVLMGVGMALDTVISPGKLDGSNPLKFAWIEPLGIIALSAINSETTRRRDLVAVIVLLAAAGVSGARSFLATGLAALVLIAWQLRPRRLSKRGSAGWTLALFLGIGISVYELGTTLLTNGYLGSDVQQKSLQQVQESGNLLLGGRPEISATWALLTHYPLGFGPGISASYQQILVAKAGMTSINYDPNNNYVNRFMFGSGVELHSTIGDLWAPFGLGGLVLALGVLVLVLCMLASRVANRTAGGLVVFFSLWTLWNLFFSPLPSALPTMILSVGLLLVPHDEALALSLPFRRSRRDADERAEDRTADRPDGPSADEADAPAGQPVRPLRSAR